MQKLTVKYNKNSHNNPDRIFEIEKQKKKKEKKNNKVNPSINNKQKDWPNKTLNRFK